MQRMQANESFFLPGLSPHTLPGLVALWDFQHSGEQFVSSGRAHYTLESQSGLLHVVDDAEAPGGRALALQEGQWLSLARANCPLLDFHGAARFTLVAWIRRDRRRVPECEFIAGQWNESHRGRQYGLFVNISVWGQRDTVFGHVSRDGGANAGFQYCMDGAQGASPVSYDAWHCIAMSFDGSNASAWLNGQLETVPGLNPYPLGSGLHDSGPDGSNFTVGAVDRGGAIGNFFTGHIGAIAVYDHCLSPADHAVLTRWNLLQNRL